MAPEKFISPGRQPRIKRVSAQHTLERVRHNQRQHRARRRAHVEALEARLAQAEQTILELRGQLSSVRAEHEKCGPQSHMIETYHDAFPLPPLPAGGGDVVQPRSQVPWNITGHPSTVGMVSYELSSSMSNPHDRNMAAMPALLLNFTSGHGIPPVPLIQSPAIMLSMPNSQPASWTGADEGPVAPCCQKDRVEGPSEQPPLGDGLPQPWAEMYFDASTDGEQTMLCSEAMALIAERNVKGVSQETITMWLWSGFRRSLHPGGGCRVQTESLFTLLAFINSG